MCEIADKYEYPKDIRILIGEIEKIVIDKAPDGQSVVPYVEFWEVLKLIQEK